MARFAAAPETPAVEVLDRMAEGGPWYALGDGETFEDMIFSTLFACGCDSCRGECGEAVGVTEESLGQLTMEVLGSRRARLLTDDPSGGSGIPHPGRRFHFPRPFYFFASYPGAGLPSSVRWFVAHSSPRVTRSGYRG